MRRDQLYAGVGQASRQVGDKFTCSAHARAVQAVSEAEALGLMMLLAHETYPAAEGWSYHQASVVAVPEAWYRKESLWQRWRNWWAGWRPGEG